MHRRFADWYEILAVTKNPDILPLRWSAVEKLASTVEPDDIPKIVRIFYSMSDDEPSKEKIRQAAKDFDPSFVIEGSDRELSILAGAVLAQIIESGPSHNADIVCLAISCMEVQGLRIRPRLNDIMEEAASYHLNESVRVRTLDMDPVLEMNSSELMQSISDKGGIPSPDINTIWTAIHTIFQKLVDLHSKHTQSINEVFNAEITRQREESDILWWLFSEHTIDGKRPFSKLSVPQACLRGAKDLAELTKFMPGPFAAPAFLKRMLRLVKKTLPSSLKLIDVIAESELELRRSWVSELKIEGLLDMCPFLFAVIKSVEVGGSNAWAAAFEHVTGLQANCELPPVNIALQIYNEALLVRALQE